MNAAKSSLEAPFVLASASPRRRELLEKVGLRPPVLPVDIDEAVAAGERGVDAARRLALAKARAALELRSDRPLLACDTLVVIEGEALGKPRDAEHALEMLTRLSSRWHEVVTGLALVFPAGRERVEHATTRVRFADLAEEEIQAYVASGEAADKAGAYAIQGGASWFVDRVEGSVTNVIGLPLEKVRTMMREEGLLGPPRFSNPL